VSPDLVTAVVPTRNSARTLGACLSSLREQTHQRLEIVVVDNASSDGSERIAAGWADHVLQAGPERSAQRNRGASRATGSYLLFVDSDMRLEPAVVAECVQAARTGATAVVIPEQSFGEGFWARCKALERSCYVGDDSIEAARFFGRDVFESVGGYDEELAGTEDWDLHERVRQAGARIGRVEALIWHDEGRLRLTQLTAKKFHYGRTFGRYLAKHPHLARTQAHPFRRAFVQHRRRLAADPVAALGMIVMKASEAAAGAAGLVSVKLRATSSASSPGYRGG
jgi:glycosyltransferase involved in cell wall biosynthesis